MENGVWVGNAINIGDVLETISTNGTQTGWKYTTANNTVEIYDMNGNLTSITKRQGLTQTLTYNASQQLVKVTDPVGRALTFTYATDGKLESVTEPSGNIISYQYDAANNLSSVTFPDNTVRSYLYENTAFPHSLTGLLDEKGNRYATWEYDATGRAIANELAGGVARVDLAFNSDGTTTVTEAGGAQRTYAFETVAGGKKLSIIEGPCTTCGASTLYNDYNADGLVTRRVDFNGNVTEYSYNDRNLQQSRTEAKGTYQERTITTEWDPNFNLPALITEPGKTTAYTYDSNGRTLSRTETDTTTGVTRSWAYTYNTAGQVTSVDGPRTDVSETLQWG